MFKARIVLAPTDVRSLLARIEAIAMSLGLSSEEPSQAMDAFTRTWRAGLAESSIEVMHATTDERLGCTYLEFIGSKRDAVVEAVAQAYAALPIRMPRDLVQEAAETWRECPQGLQRAALAVTGETAPELREVILLALREGDLEAWDAAAGAAALMPAADARRVLSHALATESSEDRKAVLSRLWQFVDEQAGDAL